MEKIPKKEEQIIIDCLKRQGFENIIYEPDGNVSPDILLNDRIAIEVRRLNQNRISGEGFIGLEQDEYTLHGLLSKIMKDASDENFDNSALVGYFFKRPLPDKKTIMREASRILKDHKPFINEFRVYNINNDDRISITMKIWPSTKKLQSQYQYGISGDDDLGGAIESLIYDNLKLVIAEKENKIKYNKNRYPEWWLAVVDTISFGLINLDDELFYGQAKIESQFDRILIVSLEDESNFTYLYK